MDLVSLKYAIIFLLQDPPKFTQILIFGLKTNHLATLIYSSDICVCDQDSRSVYSKHEFCVMRPQLLCRMTKFNVVRHKIHVSSETLFS
jgi:hypothetical protein